MATTFTDRLALARERLGIALDPAARATRMIENPAATNFGRLATARTDVPAMIPEDQAPVGFTPAQAAERMGTIDVRSYVGSRYAQPQAQGMDPAQAAARAGLGPDGQPSRSPLPVGNPAARDAILRRDFPNASPGQISGLAAIAFNRPEQFNAATGGRFDPNVARARAGADATKDALEIEGRTLNNRATALRMEQDQAALPSRLADDAMNRIKAGQGLEIDAAEADRRARLDARDMTPRLLTVGNTPGGRPIQRVVDANGNSSAVPDDERPLISPVKIGEQDYFYHREMKQLFNQAGQPVAMPRGSSDLMGGIDGLLGDVPVTTPAAPVATKPGATKPSAAKPGEIPVMTPAQAAKLPKGTKFKTSDGRILTRN